MKIVQSFEVSRAPAEVWELFQDIPAVASCMPGAELTEDKGGGNYSGRVNIKLGPFGASFEGEARVVPDPLARSAHVEGTGLDRRGGSRSKLIMDYKVTEAGASRSRVDIQAEIQLSGPIAQFGRTAVVTETASVLIGEFARNFENKLRAAAAPAQRSTTASHGESAQAPMQAANSNQISIFRILGLLISSFFSRLVGRRA